MKYLLLAIVAVICLLCFFRQAKTGREKVVGGCIVGIAAVLFLLYFSDVRGIGVSEQITKLFDEMGWGR